MKITKFGSPFSLQIEPVEGCTLACWFCALQVLRPDNGADATTRTHGERSTPYKFMTQQTMEAIAAKLEAAARTEQWNPRVEFAMHGEPTLHPTLPSFIRMIAPHFYTMVTTNGSGVTKEYQAEVLFAAGLDTLAIDDYKHAKFVQRILPWARDFCATKGVRFYRYPANPEGNPHRRSNEQRMVIIEDIIGNDTGTHQLTNQGGNSVHGPLDVALKTRCAKPFRELAVRWDGSVAVCCDDWKGEYIIGNINDMTFPEIWNHPRFEAARRALYSGERAALKPCSGCDVRTYRNGLLPDKFGKMEMPKLNKEAKEILNGK